MRNRLIMHFANFYPLYALMSLLLPAASGYILGGPTETLGCLLWAGYFRITRMHHGT